MDVELVEDHEWQITVAKYRQRAVIVVLDERRQSKKLSLRQLSKMSGMSHTTINDIFRNKWIRMWQVFLLSEALGMSTTELFFLSENRFREDISQATEMDA